MKKRAILLFIFILICVIILILLINKQYLQPKIIENKEDVVEIVKEENKSFFLYPDFSDNQIVYHSIYTLSYSEKHEQAEWVAYRLLKNSINNSVKRVDNFREDLKVKTGSATLHDYKNSGYDRGHLAPAKSMSLNEQTMSESFFMSNMSPQNPSFNRGIWKKLEEKVRSWIPISDSLYVVSGPVLKNSQSYIGKSRVTVPEYYYKSIIRFNKNKMFGIGFLLKNKSSNKSLSSFAVSIDSIEKVTGLNFFVKLDSTIQNQLESNSNYQFFLQK